MTRKIILAALLCLVCAGVMRADDAPSPPPPSPPSPLPPPAAVAPPSLSTAVQPPPPVTSMSNNIAAAAEESLPFHINDHTLARWQKYLDEGGNVEKRDPADATALMNAAMHGNLALCELLIKHGADVNYQRPSDGMTPLMYGVNGGREALELLVRHGAKLDQKDNNGNSAFFHMHRPQEDVLQFFLDAGTDINTQSDSDGDTMLIRASRHTPEMVKLMLAKGADTSLRNLRGDTALHVAVSFMSPEQSFEAVRMLLDAGANVNAKDESGQTPLHLSVSQWDIRMPVFEALLKAGADVHLQQTNHQKETPLIMALRNGHVEAAMKLLDAGADITARWEHGPIPLFLAAQAWDRPLMERLIEMGADIQETNSPAEETVLMLAAAAGDVGTVQWLLEQGMDINARSRWGKTAVIRALECKQDEVARLLVERGADLTGGEQEKQSARSGYAAQPPLQVVVERGDLEMVRFLVKHGAGFTDEETDKKKLLHCAVESGCRAMCEYILTFNPEADVRDYAGNTPLHNAASAMNYDLCVLLLSNGANPNAKSNNGQTPLMCAVRRQGHQLTPEFLELMAVRVWQLLVDAGADVKVKDNSGKTALEHMWESQDQPRSGFSIIPTLGPRIMGEVEEGSEGKARLYSWSFLNAYAENATGRYRDARTPPSLFMAVRDGDLERVRRLLEAGQDINQTSVAEETPLHFAVRAGNTEMVTFLLEKGADVNAKGHFFGTPLHYAAGLGLTDILELLLEKGADMQAQAYSQTTPLHWAVAASHGPCVVALTKKGADPGLRASKYTPFMLALRMRKEQYCKFFCQNGFDLEKYVQGAAVMHEFQAMPATPDHLRILLNCGMDINMADGQGDTFLHCAVMKREPSLVHFVLEKGGDATIKNANGQTPAEALQKYSLARPQRIQIQRMLEK